MHQSQSPVSHRCNFCLEAASCKKVVTGPSSLCITRKSRCDCSVGQARGVEASGHQQRQANARPIRRYHRPHSQSAPSHLDTISTSCSRCTRLPAGQLGPEKETRAGPALGLVKLVHRPRWCHLAPVCALVLHRNLDFKHSALLCIAGFRVFSSCLTLQCASQARGVC